MTPSCNDHKLFSRILKDFQSNNNIGIINPTVVDEAGNIQFQGGDYLFPIGTTIGRARGEKFITEDKLISSKWATGCAMFIPVKLFRELKGFDNYFMYQEDVGLSWKCLNAGKDVVTDCSSSIVHHGGGSVKPSGFEHFYSERNRVFLFWQNLSILTFLVVLPFFLLLRLATLVRYRQSSAVLAKLRGLGLGLLLMWFQPRRNSSVRNDTRVIKYFWKPLMRYNKKDLPTSAHI